MERVSIIEGKIPVIFVVPHINDTHADVVASTAAIAMRSYAVINRGWQRARYYDYDKEWADCNNVLHCLEDVVKEEFLDPIIRFKNRIRRRHTLAYIFTIHGVGNDIKRQKHDLSFVVGRGEPNNSATCLDWMIKFFAYRCNQYGLSTYVSTKGAYSASSRYNLCQYYRQWDYDSHVHAMQIEIVHSLRRDKRLAAITGEYLADVLTDLILHSTWDAPRSFQLQLI